MGNPPGQNTSRFDRWMFRFVLVTSAMLLIAIVIIFGGLAYMDWAANR